MIKLGNLKKLHLQSFINHTLYTTKYNYKGKKNTISWGTKCEGKKKRMSISLFNVNESYYLP